MASRQIPLSQIARDPVVAAFFARGEADGASPVIRSTPKPVKTGGHLVLA